MIGHNIDWNWGYKCFDSWVNCILVTRVEDPFSRWKEKKKRGFGEKNMN